MKLIKQTNDWNCIIAVTAMLLDTTIQELITKIGHDGSEVVFPELEGPMQRRGFHIQEIIPIVLEYGYAMVPIEMEPISTPNGINQFKIPKVNINKYMINRPGILLGKNVKSLWWHAVAWDGTLMYDPGGRVGYFNDFQIYTFWMFYQYQINS